MTRKTFRFQDAMSAAPRSLLGRVKRAVSDTKAPSEADVAGYRLSFLEAPKLAGVDQALVTMHSKTPAVSLTDQFHAMTAVEDYLRSVRSEMDERKTLREKLKESKKNLVLDVVCEFLNLSAIPSDLSDLKKLVKDQIRNAFMVAAGAPKELLDAVDAVSDLQGTVAKWRAHPEQFLLFVASNASNMYDVAQGVGNQIKVQFKPLIPEFVIERMTDYVTEFESACEKKNDELIELMLKELVVISNAGVITEEQRTKAATYNELLNKRLDTLHKRASEYGDDSDKLWEQFQTLSAHCSKLHVFKRVSHYGSESSQLKQIFAFFGIEEKAEELSKWADLGREIRLNPVINMAMRTHRILKEHRFFGDSAEEARFLISVETQRHHATEELNRICNKAKFRFSKNSGAENATLSATRHLVNQRKEHCVERLIASALSDLSMASGTGDAEFDQFLSKIFEKTGFTREELKKRVLDQIELLRALEDKKTPEAVLNRKIKEGLEKITSRYHHFFGADAETVSVQVPRAGVSESHESTTPLTHSASEEKKFSVDEAIERLLTYQVPKEEVDTLFASVRQYYESASEEESKRLFEKVSRVSRVCDPHLMVSMVGGRLDNDGLRQMTSLLNGYFNSCSDKKTALAKELRIRVLKEKIDRPLPPESEQAWDLLSRMTGFGEKQSIPRDKKERNTQRERFRSLLLESSERRGTLIDYMESKAYLSSGATLDPRAAYLAAYTTYELLELSSQVNALIDLLDNRMLTFFEGGVADELFRLKCTQEEIAISMLERLKLSQEGKIPDLVALLKPGTQPSQIYQLSPADIANYHAYVQAHGDSKTKAALAQLPRPSVIAAESVTELRVVLTDYVANERAAELSQRYASATGIAKQFQHMPGAPKLPGDIDLDEIRRNNEEIAVLEAKIKKVNLGLMNAFFHSITVRKDPLKVVEEMNAQIDTLKKRNKEIEVKASEFCSKVREFFSPLKIASNTEFTAPIRETQRQLAIDEARVHRNYAVKMEKISVERSSAHESLNRYLKVVQSTKHGGNILTRTFSRMRLFFMEKVGKGDEATRLNALAQKNLEEATALKERDDALARIQEKQGEADRALKSLVTHVVRGASAELMEKAGQLKPEQLRSAVVSLREFVANNDESQLAALNGRLNFSWDFLHKIATGETLEDVSSMARIAVLAKPEIEQQIFRVFMLLKGKSPYGADPAAELKADLEAIKATEEFPSDAFSLEEVYASIIDNYVTPKLETLADEIKKQGAKVTYQPAERSALDAKIEALPKLLLFLEAEKQAAFMKDQFKKLPNAVSDFTTAHKKLDAIDAYLRGKTEADLKEIKDRLSAQKTDFMSLVLAISKRVGDRDDITLETLEAELPLYELARFVFCESKEREGDYAGVFKGHELKVANELLKALPADSQKMTEFKEKYRAYVNADRALDNLPEELRSSFEHQSKSGEAALLGYMSLLPTFSNVTGYDAMYENAFSFAPDHFKRVLDPKSRAYTRSDFDRDVVFFDHADKAMPAAKKGDSSVLETSLHDAMADALSRNVLPRWNFDFACLIERFDFSHIQKYRLHGLNELVASGRNGISIPGLEAFFNDIMLAMSYGDVLPTDENAKEVVKQNAKWCSGSDGNLSAAEKAMIASLVQDQKPTWAHELIVRELGSLSQLQDMRTRWLTAELNNLRDPSDDHYPAGHLLEKIFDSLGKTDITETDLKKIFGEKNFKGMKALIKAVVKEMGDQYMLAAIDVSGSTEINANAISTTKIDERIRLFAGSVGKNLLKALKMPSVDELIVGWKSQRDLNALAKGFLHEAEFMDMSDPRYSPKEVMLELLKTPKERAADKEKRVNAYRESVRAEAQRKLDETLAAALDAGASETGAPALVSLPENLFEMKPMVPLDVRPVKTRSPYEFDYHIDPATFYRNYLLPVQTVCLTRLPTKILEGFSEVMGVDLMPTEIVQRRFAEFKNAWVTPLMGMTEKNVAPMIKLLKSEKKLLFKEPVKSLGDLEAMLMRFARGMNMEDIDSCKIWCRSNRGRKSVDAILLYLDACQNAVKIKNLAKAAERFLEIELFVTAMTQGKKGPDDFNELILPFRAEFAGPLKALSGRMQFSLNLLIQEVRSTLLSAGAVDQNKLDQLHLLVGTFGSRAQITQLERVMQVAAVLNKPLRDIEKEVSLTDRFDEEVRSLFAAAIVAKIKSIGIAGSFVDDLGSLFEIASRLKHSEVDAYLTQKNTDIVRSVFSKAEEADNWHLRALSRLFELNNAAHFMDEGVVVSMVVSAAKKERKDRSIEERLFSPAIPLIVRRMDDLLGAAGLSRLDALKEELVDEIFMTGSGTSGGVRKVKRGTEAAIGLLNDELQDCIRVVQHAGSKQKTEMLEKIAEFLRQPHKDDLHKAQADLLWASLSPAQKTAVQLFKFFDKHGALDYSKVMASSKEFQRIMADYRSLSSDAQSLLGLNRLIEIAVKGAHLRVGTAVQSFGGSPDLFGCDADTEIDRKNREKNETEIAGSYLILSAASDVKTYNDQLREVIYPHYLRYVVYRGGDYNDPSEQKKFMRYGLLESLYRVSGIPETPSLAVLSRARKSGGYAGLQQMFAKGDKSREFFNLCRKEWGKMSLDDLLKLEKDHINFHQPLVVEAKKDADIEIAVWKKKYLTIVSPELHNQIERECYLKRLTEKVASMPDSDPEKAGLKKQIACERDALFVRRDLADSLTKKIRASVSPVFDYVPVQAAIDRDGDGEIIRLTQLGDASLGNKISGSWGGIRENPNLFKYEEIHALYFLLDKLCVEISKGEGYTSRVNLAFATLQERLESTKQRIAEKGEGGGGFSRLVDTAYDQVLKVHAEWDADLIKHKRPGFAPEAAAVSSRDDHGVRK